MNNLLEDLTNLKQNLDKLAIENINNLNLDKTVVFIVDMNNGFAKSGSLYSPRIESLINPIEKFTKSISDKVNNIIAFTDSHNIDSIELESYPSHCLTNSIESELIDELKAIKNINIIPKNSTNGFFVLNDINFNNIDNIIIVGNCTDICVYQFATTLKSYFNENNILKNIIVPINLVDTYDTPNTHPAELLNIIFFNSMLQNGINVVKELVFN